MYIVEGWLKGYTYATRGSAEKSKLNFNKFARTEHRSDTRLLSIINLCTEYVHRVMSRKTKKNEFLKETGLNLSGNDGNSTYEY